MDKLKIKKNDIIKFFMYFILIFPFFRITFLTVTFPTIEKFYKILQIIDCAIIILLIIKGFRYSKIINYIVIYFFVLVFSTLLNSADISGSIFLSIKTIVLCFIIDYGIKKDTKVFLNSFEFFLSILVYLNFLTIIIFKNGMYVNEVAGYTENWLLGYRNLHILYILPAIMISFINSYFCKEKLSFRNYILLIVSFISLYITRSSTSLIGIFFIITFIILNKIIKKSKNLTKILNIRTYFITYIVLFFSVVIFRIQNLFKFLIVDILKKDLTFTGRTYIWDYVIEFIKEKKVFGYGIEDSMLRLRKTNYWLSTHAHDQILEIIYKTGFVGILVYIILMIKSFKEIYKYKNNIIAKFISIVIFSYLIMMLTEFYSLDMCMFLFVICFNIKYLVKDY